MDHEERYLEAVTAAEAEVSRVLVTLLFTDIVGSTERAAELGDRAWMRLVEAHHATVRELFTRFDGREVDCAGDGFFATFDTASSAIRCGDAISASVRSLGLQVRAGLHTGECEHRDGRFKRWPCTRRPGWPGSLSRARSWSRPPSAMWWPGRGIRFEDRGSRTLKGVPGLWQLYAVAGQRPLDPPVLACARERWSAQQVRVAGRPADRRVLGHENRPERMNPRLRRGSSLLRASARAPRRRCACRRGDLVISCGASARGSRSIQSFTPRGLPTCTSAGSSSIVHSSARIASTPRTSIGRPTMDDRNSDTWFASHAAFDRKFVG